ncbi:hypothetical protein PYCCODRAFT_1236207 [Trametes coccinea BRFM310]|uniref:Uncharacterized protein n=1 Tax=Trametes coccinea (strain BRFM310) TaxID=1353009 RepID=A0A1Y2IWC6_TRAC3|nr:hypothetical protein PYCCODRAFT_1236207 [Trametes coccinea BRFM310]
MLSLEKPSCQMAAWPLPASLSSITSTRTHAASCPVFPSSPSSSLSIPGRVFLLPAIFSVPQSALLVCSSAESRRVTPPRLPPHPPRATIMAILLPRCGLLRPNPAPRPSFSLPAPASTPPLPSSLTNSLASRVQMHRSDLLPPVILLYTVDIFAVLSGLAVILSFCRCVASLMSFHPCFLSPRLQPCARLCSCYLPTASSCRRPHPPSAGIRTFYRSTAFQLRTHKVPCSHLS